MKKRLVLVILCGLFVFAACSNNNVEPEVEESQVVEEVEDETEVEEDVNEEPEIEEAEDEPTENGDFTGFDQFLTLDMGLSIDEVTAILGEPTSTTTMDLAGVESTTNIWMDISTDGGVSTTVTFSDGYATSILETLADSSHVSIADYNEISTGMTEAEVYEVLGEPYSVMVMEVLSMTSTTVTWLNSDFSSITITFTDGVVSSSLQSNLD